MLRQIRILNIGLCGAVWDVFEVVVGHLNYNDYGSEIKIILLEILARLYY